MASMIDAHLHFMADHPESQKLLDELDVKLLNICVAHDDRWRKREAEPYEMLHKMRPDRFAWCTSFTLPKPDADPAAYARQCIEGLERDLTDGGAIACKVWKNIGMELRDSAGNFVMCDNEIFSPIYQYLAEKNVSLMMHIGEPLACWRPISEPSPHQEYYKNFPQWHMHDRPEVPHHGKQIEARDNVAAKFPKLRVIGAHLGSLEFSLEEMAARFDRYPNYAMDTSARLTDMMSFPTDQAREFLIKYQDRVLFGTDAVSRDLHTQLEPERREKILEGYKHNCLTNRRFYGTDEVISIKAGDFRGVGLPEDVFEKIMFHNAIKWYPGLL